MVERAKRTVRDTASQVDQTATQSLQTALDVIKPITKNVLDSEKVKTNNTLNDLQNEVYVFALSQKNRT